MDVRAERRLVTCLFVDVAGSTDATVRLGPERMQRLLGEAFAEMGALIAEHGGTIEKFVGDAIFALFGAPVAHGDDAERALRAADASARWSSASMLSGAGLGVRIGLETGEALVDIAAVQRGQRMAVGACVNTAARLQQRAEPGQIVVGPTCREATEQIARFESLGTLGLKGLGDVEGWRFIEFAAQGARQLPFVGREAELELLLRAFARADEGRASLALIVGPPGQGKSRLAAEAVSHCETGHSVRVLQARCRPGTEAGINTPLRQLLSSDVADLTADGVRSTVVELLGAEEGEPAAQAICHAAGLAASERLLATSRIEQREVIAEAWRRYLVALANERTTVAWIEDLHWADPVLLRVIDHVTTDVKARLLVLATARPEFVGSAHLRPFTDDSRVLIDLPPLDPEASEQLARHARETSPEIARARGNPLFIIELARSQSATRSLPMTIQAAIEARLDELSSAERDMLQRASVAGERFAVRDAALLADLEPAEAAGMLGRVAHLGFVEQDGSRYRYHHVLVRDTAYGRLPVAQRMQLHATYAVEGVDPADVEARAHHWWEAVNPADADWVWEDKPRLAQMRHEALQAQLAAGHSLEQRNAYEEALEVYTRALTLAEKPLDLANAHAGVGRAYARQAKGDEAWEQRVQALESFAAARHPAPGELYADMLEIATMNWGYFQRVPEDDQVMRLLADGEQATRESGDDVSLARLLVQRAAFTEEVDGLGEVERLLESGEPERFGESAHRVAQIYLWNGRVSDALSLYETVFERLLPSGAVINEPEALIWYALAAVYAGDRARADAVCERLLEEAARRSPHTRQHAYAVQVLLLLTRGEWDRLREAVREMIDLVDAHPGSGFCLMGSSAVGYGAAADVLAGRPLPERLDSLVERINPQSRPIQAAATMLPKAMLGDRDAVAEGLSAYADGLRLLDRMRAWDLSDLVPAIALTTLERWNELERPLARLDQFGRGGARLAAAVAAAVREERSAADGGPRPDHAALRALGYDGISELLSFRPRVPAAARR